MADLSTLNSLIGDHLVLYEAVADTEESESVCKKIWDSFSKTIPASSRVKTVSSSSSSLSDAPRLLAAPVKIAEDVEETDISNTASSSSSLSSASVVAPASKPRKTRVKQATRSSSTNTASETVVVHAAGPTDEKEDDYQDEDDQDEDEERDDTALVPQRLETYFKSGVR